MIGDPPLVVMGVSASGKSTLAAALAEARGAMFVDADDLHPEANVRKMSAGTPLDDADRMPWLDIVGARLAADESGRSVIVACSALKRAYRDRLRAAAPGVLFLQLDGDRETLMRRAGQRRDHFMPPALLDSQLATLESLESDEGGMLVDIDLSVAEAVGQVEAWLDGGDVPEAKPLPVRSSPLDPL
ncbi:gluconokinase [Microbacterium murale]|uniref:Gluconokinase n=1 Tax=Microbacterium murale TaxID=1081040 RepID=A0ABU0PA41_9MICO|nr:gluconokinase [Microbacterium murale]MDQ0644207.1 gluconokinase [Microbacterium murale]